MSAPTIPFPSSGVPADDATPHDGTVVRAHGVRVWRWTAYDVIAWTLVALLFSLQGMTEEPFHRTFVKQYVGFLPCMLFTPLIAWVALRFRLGERRDARAIGAHLGMLLLFTIGGGMMMGWFEWLLPWHAPAPLGATLRSAPIRYFGVDTLIYFMVVAIVMTAAYTEESRERSVRAARLQAQLAEAQLHALGAQLQPHFLFNTLHVISALVRHDPRRAEQLIARMSELLREMLDNSDRVECTLQDELAFLEKYVDIQEARFGPRLRVTFEAAPETLGARVPRLVLQPLVENAIRHGIARRSVPGSVVISASSAAGVLTLVVRDDGVGLPAGGVAREGVGLATTRARLAQLYGDAHLLTIAPAPDGGTVCTIRIPCRTDGHPVEVSAC
jgi:signal transduction histidine kinase